MLSEESFHRLLARLDPDPDRAAEQYESLRQKLTRFFEWRGATGHADELADEALDRLARKVEAGAVKESVSSYAYGIARIVLLEASRGGRQREVPLAAVPEPVAPAPGERDRPEQECFEECIRRLAPDSRQLILDYYREERIAKIEARQSLAARLRIPLNALRIRAHRIRGQLEACVKKCQEHGLG